VSCSNIIALKRVTLIASSIGRLNFDVKWIHFGDGPEMSLVREIIGKFPDNISVELKGRVTNTELINFYSVNKVDLFIHLSLTEGFGYSIIEAFSFGIPAVLFPGGAVKELIDERYCVAVSGSDSEEDIANLIYVARAKFNLTSEFRGEIINSCKQKFDINYQGKELYNLIEGNTRTSNFPD
jgi:glycosyltransferase involved in cell wall biosynthesis